MTAVVGAFMLAVLLAETAYRHIGRRPGNVERRLVRCLRAGHLSPAHYRRAMEELARKEARRGVLH